MRGIMKSLGVKMSGEAKMRALVKKVIIDYVVSISVCFVFMEKRGKQKIPYHVIETLAYIQDVEGLLRNLLDAYSAVEMLTWHDVMISTLIISMLISAMCTLPFLIVGLCHFGELQHK